jgi:transcriptional regulator with XRE-family HTH domain
MDVGARITELRNKKNIPQTRLAELINTTQQAVSNYEKNKPIPGFAILEKLCDALDVTFVEFFSVEQDLSALPSDLHAFVIQKENRDLLRFIAEMKEKGYSSEGITEWLQSLKSTVEGILQKGLIGKQQVIFDPEIKEDTEKLLADFVEKKRK